ncbi:hypothetical protein V8C34DRAFT_299964 [Trichoderma compactum]
MTESIEKAILSALKDVQNGISQRKAAQRWGIPRITLQTRLNGGHNLGLPPTHQQVREFTTRILKAGGDDQPLGKQ